MASAEDRKLIEQARNHFKICVDAEHDMRQKALDDLRFLAGEQWDPRALAQRGRDNRPALVVNRMDQFVQHITNSSRMNRVSARVFPVDDAGDVDTAEVIQGMIRHIEYDSNALLAYNTAEFYAVAAGFGYWGLTTDYCDPLSFDLDVKIRRFQNPFQVYLGPHAMPDGSDAPYGFVFSDLTREEFEAEYPDADATSITDWASLGDKDDEWLKKDMIRVAEYYCIHYENDTLVKMADGSAKLKKQLSEEVFKAPNLAQIFSLDDNGKIIQRATRIPTVKWYKLTAIEVLDDTVWPVPQVPIIKVIGNELTVEGKTTFKGIVRNLKDAQRQYNVMLSAQTEAIDSSKGNLVLAEGQEEDHEDEIQNLTRGKPIRYKPTAHEGNLLPAPNRLPPNMSIAHMNEARLMAADDLKALTGIYDAALGQRSNETSGTGINARKQQSEIANFHFQDNLTLSISCSTKMMVSLISKIYDVPRVIRTIGEDESQKVVKINQQFADESGENKFFNMKVGKYDVICTSGPNFQSKRQEGAQMLTQLAQAAPILMSAAPDLIIKTYDIPYAQEISERLAKTLPPGLVDQPGQKDVPPEVQQQMQKMGQTIDLLSKELEAKTELVQGKQMELASREKIEVAKIDSNERIAHAQMYSDEAIATLKAEVDAMKAKVSVLTQKLAQDAAAAAQTIDHEHESDLASQNMAFQASQQPEQTKAP